MIVPTLPARPAPPAGGHHKASDQTDRMLYGAIRLNGVTMKDNRQIQIGLWTLPGSGETVEITVRYPTFADMERVYTLHAQPVKIEQREGFIVKSYLPHRGYFTRLEAAARYSRKRLEALAGADETLVLARGMFDRIGKDTTPAD